MNHDKGFWQSNIERSQNAPVILQALLVAGTLAFAVYSAWSDQYLYVFFNNLQLAIFAPYYFPLFSFFAAWVASLVIVIPPYWLLLYIFSGNTKTL